MEDQIETKFYEIRELVDTHEELKNLGQKKLSKIAKFFTVFERLGYDIKEVKELVKLKQELSKLDIEPSKLNPAPYNPRKIDEENLKRLAQLMNSHGFVDPIIARKEDNVIIGGHQRLKANQLREQPDEKVPVIFLEGLSDAQTKALNISLNNPKAQGIFFVRLVSSGM